MEKKKVLIVDDEPIICESVKSDFMRMEHPWEYEVYTANSVIRAEEIYYEVQPQLVLTDIKMPKGTGLLLVSEVRRDNPDCCILVLSAYDNFEYVRNAFTMGADDYLLKPIAFSELEKRVLDLLEKTGTKLPQKSERKLWKMEDVLAYLDQHIGEKIGAAEMAKKMGISHTTFGKKFREHTSMTFSAYVRTRRMELAKEYLKNSHIKIKQIAAKLGYRDDPQHFSRDFTQYAGISPKEYRARSITEDVEKT